MATKDLINLGVGFAPGSVKFIVTLGLEVGEEVDIWTRTTADDAVWSKDTPDTATWTKTT